MGSSKELFYFKIVTTVSKRTCRILSGSKGNCIREKRLLNDKTMSRNKGCGCTAELLDTDTGNAYICNGSRKTQTY